MALSDVRLATGPVSWGVDFADSPDNPPWQEVLDDIQRSGIGALELGPVGFLPEDPTELREALQSRALTAVGSFVFESLHDPGAQDHVIEVAERACRTISAAGGNILVIIDRPGRARAATAGRSHFAPRLPTGLWQLMVQLIERVAELAREHGLEPAFHPHAGSYIEFTDEIDRLLTDTEIGLCLDTGHATYARIGAHDAIKAYESRIVHVHLKDLDVRVLDRVPLERLGFWRAIEANVFCPVGQGTVDFGAVAKALTEIDYTGFATIEQDRVPGSGTPLADLAKSLAWLKGTGLQSSRTPVEANPGCSRQ
jgi:inosose dehydratase